MKETRVDRDVVGVAPKKTAEPGTAKNVNPLAGGSRNGTQSSRVDGTSNRQMSGTANNKSGVEKSRGAI